MPDSPEVRGFIKQACQVGLSEWMSRALLVKMGGLQHLDLKSSLRNFNPKKVEVPRPAEIRRPAEVERPAETRYPEIDRDIRISAPAPITRPTLSPTQLQEPPQISKPAEITRPSIPPQKSIKAPTLPAVKAIDTSSSSLLNRRLPGSQLS